MANFAFTSFLNQLWGTGTHVDFLADNIEGIFIDHAVDTPTAADDFMDDLTAGSWCPTTLSAAPVLTSPTVTAGVYDAADLLFTSLAAGSTPNVESLVLYKNVGPDTAASCPLLLRWDTATGLPLVPNGANVTVAWNASGIASIA